MWIELVDFRLTDKQKRLNPYSNGMWIEQNKPLFYKDVVRLNPYSNGMWIERKGRRRPNRVCRSVLILILMECG